MDIKEREFVAFEVEETESLNSSPPASVAKNFERHIPFPELPLEQKEFLFKEYDTLRKEIEQSVKDMETLGRYALVVTAAVWAWLLKDAPSVTYSLIKYVPTGLSLLFLLKAFALRKAISRTAVYIAQLESYLKLPEPFGWENYLRKVGGYWVDGWEAFYWVTLVFTNFAAAFLLKR